MTPGMQSLAFYIGQWNCEGVQYDDSGEITGKEQLLVEVTPDMDNWIHVVVSEHGKRVNSELKGWDPAGNVFHHYWTGSDGSSGSFASKGWQGNEMLFEDDRAIGNQRFRMRFVKIDDTHYNHAADVSTNHQEWKRDYQKTCHKI
jgi:hypothetical protein